MLASPPSAASACTLRSCPRPGGETGRRKGLKIPPPQGDAGSTPAPGTIRISHYSVGGVLYSADPAPGAKAIIVLALNYYREKPDTPPDHGRISRYAWGRDYHKVFRGILKDLLQYLQENFPGHQHKLCVDSAPLMEKVYANQAGIGFYGKNSILISPTIGSYFLLGELVTTLDLIADTPPKTITNATCGTCTRCRDACPTGALDIPGQIDARRCISYLTIESKNPIPSEFASDTSNLIMGCDICQEVCPYNIRLAKPATHPAFTTGKIAGDQIPLAEILQICNDQQYLQRFAGSPLMRAKRLGLIKNAINAAVNAITQNPSAYKENLLPLIQKIATDDENPRLRQIATEAINKLKTI